MSKEDQKKPFHRRWRYHRDHKPKLLESQEEFEKLGAGWVDSPLKVHEPFEKKAEPEKTETEAQTEEMIGEGQLKEILQSQGVPAKKLKGKSREELLAMLSE